MTKADFEAFAEELAKLSELYDQQVSEALSLLYFDSLLTYPIEEVIQAMRAHVRQPKQGRFFPKPADLIALLDGDSDFLAWKAWTEAVAAWEEHGVYESVAFQDPCIMAVIDDMGGWVAFHDRYMELKEEPFMRQEFVTRYRGSLRRSPQRSLAHLPGLHEISNRRNGYLAEIPTARQIGSSRTRRALPPLERKALSVEMG